MSAVLNLVGAFLSAILSYLVGRPILRLSVLLAAGGSCCFLLASPFIAEVPPAEHVPGTPLLDPQLQPSQIDLLPGDGPVQFRQDLPHHRRRRLGSHSLRLGGQGVAFARPE